MKKCVVDDIQYINNVDYYISFSYTPILIRTGKVIEIEIVSSH